MTALMGQVLQTGLEVELADHLGYEAYDPAGRGSGNSRNGSYPKTVSTEIGSVELRVPRDRAGTFEPVTVPKHVRRLDGLSGNVISLYAKGLTTGEIQAHLEEMYGTSVSRDTVSKITDQIVADMAAWQNRPLDRRVYAVLLIDAIVIKVRDSQVANRPVYVAIGVNMECGDDERGARQPGRFSHHPAEQYLCIIDARRRNYHCGIRKRSVRSIGHDHEEPVPTVSPG